MMVNSMSAISRRSFIQSASVAAGSLLLPSFVIAQPKRLPVDLTKFCEKDEFARYDLTKPFTQGDSTYGTDGRVCVRIPAMNPLLGDEERRLPKADKLWWNHTAEINWQPWPRESLIRTPENYRPECIECEGTGRIGLDVVVCDLCEQLGWVPCNADDRDAEFEDDVYFKTCPKCKGEEWIGGVECEFCDGYGTTDRPTIQPIGDLFICGRYSRLVRSLGDVEFHMPHSELPAGNAGRVIAFRANGAEGLLMPMCYSKSDFSKIKNVAHRVAPESRSPALAKIGEGR